MLSILVGHSYFLQFDQKQRERAKPYPPLATLQVAANLRQSGHRVLLFDAMLANGVEDYRRQLITASPQVALFYEDNFNFLSKMCLGKMRQAACEMISTACRAGARVIVAGSDASDAPEAYLTAGAEVVLIGEGLVTLRLLLDRIDNDPQIATAELLEGLTGIASLNKGKINTMLFGSPSPDPQPPALAAWDLVDMERYRSVWREKHGYFSLNMATSRGCSFRCNWCSKPIWGNRYLQRSAADAAAEMTHLKNTFNPDHIWFADDIFGFRVDWVTEFAEAVNATAGSIPFTIQSRADLISASMARALRLAGCSEVWIGAESGSQKILDAMNKGTKVADIPLARKRLAAENIRVGFFIQLGYLDEQLEDILATRQLIEDARPDDIGVSVSYPLPGTKFHERVKKQLQAKTRWRESNDLEMMFEGTYSSDFYRSIRNLLHDQVLLDQQHSCSPAELVNSNRLVLQQRWNTLISREQEYRTYSVEAQAFS